MANAEQAPAAQDATDQTTNTQPETQQTATTQQSQLSPEDALKELEKVRREAAKYRTRAKELEDAAEAARTEAERAKLDDLERERAEKADLQKQLEAERAERVNAQRQAALTGKVADPAAALKLLDPEKHVDEDGTVNVAALLESFPFLAPQATEGVRLPGSKTTRDAPIAQLQEQLATAKTRQERIAIQRRIHEAQKG